MERAVAIQKLVKLLGKKLGYQIHKDAPTPEERERAKAQLTPAIADRKKLSEDLASRQTFLLETDPEYKALLAVYGIARKRAEELSWKSRQCKITVGTNEGPFFRIEAEGDSWEEIIEKLTAKREA